MISIIVPTYNREYIIKKSIDSLIKQTYKDIEIIVVDDGSTDKTRDIIEKYEDKRIKFIRLEKNKGACYARNIGIKNARGDFITFHDSDDVCSPSKLEMQYENMKKNNSDIDFCDGYKFYNGKMIKKVPSNYIKIVMFFYSYYYTACYQNYISTPCLMVKREVLKKNMFDESLPRYQDYDLIIRLLSKYKVSHTKKVLVQQEIQENSISKNNAKGIEAINKMVHKNYGIKEKYRKMFLANLYEMRAFLCDDEKNKISYICKSLQTKFRLRTLVKLLIEIMLCRLKEKQK